ncbi:hypothetical protein RB195_022040 [Necator americanus]|uniref:DNA2/NAM7 helicase-like C-terminal domain-containing protein n=1 Tax=Necator americanus TaxID=51031 RepID=A0ABR1EDS3_NECAM
MFINVDGQSEHAANMSHYNSAEVEVCLELLRALLRRGLTPAQLCVITFYREQYRRLERAADELGVELSTVDSVQGREKEVVLLLTTRTHVAPESAEFLDEYRRMNVAISQCRQGQFIFGHVRSLRRVPFWGRVISWASSLNAIVPATDLPRYFENE